MNDLPPALDIDWQKLRTSGMPAYEHILHQLADGYCALAERRATARYYAYAWLIAVAVVHLLFRLLVPRRGPA